MWVAALAASPSKHNAGQKQGKAQKQRNDVAEAREGRGRGWGRQLSVDDARGLPRQRFHDLPMSIDHCADSSRSRADDRNALLRGAEPSLGEMLRWAPTAEPRVVRRVEDEVGPVAAIDHVA